MLNQSVVVDNNGGGSGNVAYGHVARATPDGYTLLTSYSAYHVGNPVAHAQAALGAEGLAPVALITVATNVIAVHPSVPANTLGEFIAYLKKNPGKLSYASQGNGSLSHVGTEMFKMQTGTSMVHIPYRGSGPAIQDVLSGQVQVFITTPPSVMGHVQAGKLKGLAVTGKSRHPGVPNVPTTAEAGLKGFELEAWVGHLRAGRHAAGRGRQAHRRDQAGAGPARDQDPRHHRRHRAALPAAGCAGRAGEARNRVLGQDHQGGQHHGGVSAARPSVMPAKAGIQGVRLQRIRGSSGSPPPRG